MPTCTHCGGFNADNAALCSKCGIPLGSQRRAEAGRARQQTATYIRGGVWLIVIVIVAIVAMPIYHASNSAYQKFHLDSVTQNAMKSCGGPATASMSVYEQAQVNDCLAKDEDFVKAKQDYAAFTSAEKR